MEWSYEKIRKEADNLGPDRYDNEVYEGFKHDVCYYCMCAKDCSCSKEEIFNCPKFENYYLI